MTKKEHELKKMSENITENNASEKVVTGLWSQVTLEPVMVGAMMAFFFTQTSQINLYMRTACVVDLHYPEEICDNLTSDKGRKVEIIIQEYVSKIKAPRGFVIAAVTTVVVMFLGPWSDCSRRRKPLLVVSLIGMIISSISTLLLLAFPGLSAGWIMYITQMPLAFGGFFTLLMSAGFCYISDVCKQTGRDTTVAFGITRAAMQGACVVGWLTGPLIFRQLGYFGVYGSALLMQVAALGWLHRLHDVQVNTQNRVRVFDLRLPVAAVRCLFAKRAHHRRAIVLMMALVSMMDKAMFEADDLISFLYFRNKFAWDDILYGFFSAYKYTILFLGMVLTLKFLKIRYHMSDEMIGVLSGVSLAASKLVLIGVHSTALVFLAPVVGVISSNSMTVLRTILNKNIDVSEQGKIHSVSGALEQAFQAAVIPFFPLLYAKTVDTAPDAWLGVFVFKGSLQAVLFTTTIILTKRQTVMEIMEFNEGNIKDVENEIVNNEECQSEVLLSNKELNSADLCENSEKEEANDRSEVEVRKKVVDDFAKENSVILEDDQNDLGVNETLNKPC